MIPARPDTVSTLPGKVELAQASRAYLDAMQLADDILMLDSGDRLPVLPPWAAFLIWLGWYLRRHASNESRLAAVVVLPVRRSAAALVGFGAELAAAQLSVGKLDWISLSRLSPGTTVYLQQTKKQNKSGGTQVTGIIDEPVVFDGREFVVIVDQSNGSKTMLSVDHLAGYTITLRPTGRRTKTALHQHGKFFHRLIAEFDPRWFLKASTEAVLVGETTSVRRISQSILVRTGEDPTTFTIGKMLGLEPSSDTVPKVRLLSDRSLPDEGVRAPVCILDGRGAWRGLEQFVFSANAGSFAVILERSEFDEQVLQSVTEWRAAADMSALPFIAALPTTLPHGIEFLLCPLPG